MPDTGYTYLLTDTVNDKISVQRLQFEIQNDGSINQLSTYVNANNIDFTVYFKTPLTTSEKTALDNLVNAHEGLEFLVDRAKLVRVNEEDDDPNKRTGGHFRAKQYEFSIPTGNGPHIFDYSLPFDIGILSMYYFGHSEMAGDYFTIEIARGTILGALTQDSIVGDNIFNVSSTVVANAFVGMKFFLSDGTNEDYLGFITEIDVINGTITTSDTATNAFLAATPTYCKISTLVIEDHYIYETAVPVPIGATKIGASFVAANTTISFIYTNTSGLAGKTFRGVLEFLY